MSEVSRMNDINSTGRISCPQLTTSTFARWQFQIKNVLEAEGVLDIVEGFEKQPVVKLLPSETGYQAEIDGYNRWRKRDARARAIISSSLDDMNDGYVRGSRSSSDVLIGIHEKKPLQVNPRHGKSFSVILGLKMFQLQLLYPMLMD